MAALTTYLFLTCIIGYSVSSLRSKKMIHIYLRIVFFIAFLYMGLRGKTVGVDTRNYNSIFYGILQNGSLGYVRDREIEVGFKILVAFLGRIVEHPQVLHLFISAVVNGAVCSLIEKYSKDCVLSSVIYISTVFMAAMNVSRQIIALAFIFMMTQAIFEKNTIKAVIWGVIATSMHNSAIVILPMIMFASNKYPLTKKRGIMVSGLMFMLIPLYSVVVNIFVGIFPQYSWFLSEYSKHSGGRELETAQFLLFGIVLFLGILYIQPLRVNGNKMITFVANSKKEKCGALGTEESQYMYFFVMFIGYIVVYLMSAKLSILSRFTYFFQGFMIIMIPNTIAMLKSKYRVSTLTTIVKIAFVAYYLYFGVRYFQNDPHSIFPYMFFWE